MMLVTITVIVMSEAGGQSDEEMLNISLQSLPSHEASGMITDDPHILPVLVSEYTIVYDVTEPLIPSEMLNDSCTHSKQPHDQWFLLCICIE